VSRIGGWWAGSSRMSSRRCIRCSSSSASSAVVHSETIAVYWSVRPMDFAGLGGILERFGEETCAGVSVCSRRSLSQLRR
jgi:hypothetical protein